MIDHFIVALIVCLDTTYKARAVLTYSARRYDSAVGCSKMSCDAFLSEALYKADKNA